MRTSAKLRIARMRMLARAIWPDANPLRRTSDRVETWILVTLGAIYMIGAPVIAVLAAGYIYGAGVRAERTSHLVTAILQGNARRDGSQIVTAPVRWIAPDGRTHLGRIHVQAGTRAGSEVRTWADDSGRLVGVPPQRNDLAREAAIAAILAVAGLSGLLIGAAAIARLVLVRRRMAGWEADWRLTEPLWVRPSEL